MIEKIIRYDSPEAATYMTGISGWVSADGRYFGDNEHAARYAGCTHVLCRACKAPTRKGRTWCDACRHKADVEMALIEGAVNAVQHIVSVSGGKDSTATYLLAIELGVKFRAVFADTGNEHDETYSYVERLHERTGGPKVETVRANFEKEIAAKRLFIANDTRNKRRNGRRMRWTNKEKRRALDVLVPTGNPYLDLCLWKGRFPSRMAQFCTEELKQHPIRMDVVLPALRNGPVIQWLGIRAEESVNRAKQPRFNIDDTGSMLWRPIFDWKLGDVWAIHKRHGIEPNPLYASGMGRVGCMPCINCRKDELRQIGDKFPEHIERIAEWEQIVAKASKRNAATFFAFSKTNPKGSKTPRMRNDEIATMANIKQAISWSKTGRGGKQLSMFFDSQAGGGCPSDLGLCEVAT